MKKVIIAKDISALIEKEKSFLGRSDIKILKADTNSKALALHRAEKADLIIAKLDSPDMSGEKLCSLIRNDDELRRVSIMIICSASEADSERCIKCDANAYMSIPINTAVLLQEAHHFLYIAPRESYRIPIKIKLEGKRNGSSFTGYSENISSSGMFFRSSAELFEGDTIICSFSLGPRLITATAEIVRVLPKVPGLGAGYGVSFVDIRPDAVSVIEEFAASPNKG